MRDANVMHGQKVTQEIKEITVVFYSSQSDLHWQHFMNLEMMVYKFTSVFILPVSLFFHIFNFAQLAMQWQTETQKGHTGFRGKLFNVDGH